MLDFPYEDNSLCCVHLSISLTTASKLTMHYIHRYKIKTRPTSEEPSPLSLSSTFIYVSFIHLISHSTDIHQVVCNAQTPTKILGKQH